MALSSAWQIASAPSQSWRSPTLLDNLHLNDSIPTPSLAELKPGHVLLRIRAAGINARDVMVIAHDPIYPVTNIPDVTPCCDGAAEVVAAGPDSVWRAGDRVMIHTSSWIEQEVSPIFHTAAGKGAGDVQGTLRQFAVLEDTHLIAAPPHLSFEEVASMNGAGGTAMNALFFGPKALKKGMTVLTQGTGGVSCFVIQIAAAVGATVIATSSSDAKLEIVKKLGATHTVNYKNTPDWDQEVLRITHGEGVDHVIEIGGAGSIEKSVTCTKHGGLISVVGFLAEPKETDIVPALLFGAKTVRGVLNVKKEHAEAMVKLYADKNLHPPDLTVFAWEDARKAFEKAMGYEVVGKIVIKV